MKPILPIAAVLAVAVSACTPTTGPEAAGQQSAARECFFVNEVRSFASDNSREVYVRASRDAVYRLDTIGCNNVDWSTSIGIRARGGGSSICAGYDAELIVPGDVGGARSCPVTRVTRLTEAEVAALTSRQTP